MTYTIVYCFDNALALLWELHSQGDADAFDALMKMIEKSIPLVDSDIGNSRLDVMFS